MSKILNSTVRALTTAVAFTIQSPQTRYARIKHLYDASIPSRRRQKLQKFATHAKDTDMMLQTSLSEDPDRERRLNRALRRSGSTRSLATYMTPRLPDISLENRFLVGLEAEDDWGKVQSVRCAVRLRENKRHCVEVQSK